MRKKYQYAQFKAKSKYSIPRNKSEPIDGEEYTAPDKPILTVTQTDKSTLTVTSEYKANTFLFARIFGTILTQGVFQKVKITDSVHPERDGTYYKWIDYGMFIASFREEIFFSSMGEVHEFLLKKFPQFDIIYDLSIKSTVHNDRQRQNPSHDGANRTKLLGYDPAHQREGATTCD
jgi:hypothetical protein